MEAQRPLFLETEDSIRLVKHLEKVGQIKIIRKNKSFFISRIGNQYLMYVEL
jgi:hypothetical protein